MEEYVSPSFIGGVSGDRASVSGASTTAGDLGRVGSTRDAVAAAVSTSDGGVGSRLVTFIGVSTLLGKIAGADVVAFVGPLASSASHCPRRAGSSEIGSGDLSVPLNHSDAPLSGTVHQL